MKIRRKNIYIAANIKTEQ